MEIEKWDEDKKWERRKLNYGSSNENHLAIFIIAKIKTFFALVFSFLSRVPHDP